MFSQNVIEEDENKLNIHKSSKSIKSTRSIQFKNSNEFERFTYVKDTKQNEDPKPLKKSNNNGSSCCIIM